MNFFHFALILLVSLPSVHGRLSGYGRVNTGWGPGDDDEPVDIVITFRQDTNEQNGGSFAIMSKTFTALPTEDVEVHALLNNLRMATAKVKPSIIAALMNDPNVEFIDRDEEFHMDWDHEKVNTWVEKSIGDKTIPAFMGDVSGGCDSPNVVKVAVIDSGIDASHSDFEFCQKGFCVGKSLLNPGSREWATSKNGHGSHVTGIIAASILNGAHANGMVSDEKVCLIIPRVFNDSGGGANLKVVVEALDYAIEEGAHIVNMSFGIGVNLSALHAAIQRMRAAGILAVASAGNLGQETENWPAYYEETLAVAAVEDNGEWASFSTFNDKVDISAFGRNIISTLPNNNSGPMDGTSMSAPFVAGAAALMKRDCMRCTGQDLWECLVDTAKPLNCNVKKCGAGLLQAGEAYECVRSLPCCADEAADVTHGFVYPTTTSLATTTPATTTSTATTTARVNPPRMMCKASFEMCTRGTECCSGFCRWLRVGGQRCTSPRNLRDRSLQHEPEFIAH